MAITTKDMNNINLNRFLKAQENTYNQALKEIRAGKKSSHWMWYIFPQIKGLGRSETAKHYSIQNLEEAKAYLNHPILGARLKEITNVLLELNQTNAHTIFGSPDDLKLKSSMTLFSLVNDPKNNIFLEVLQKYFNGQVDQKTIDLTAG